MSLLHAESRATALRLRLTLRFAEQGLRGVLIDDLDEGRLTALPLGLDLDPANQVGDVSDLGASQNGSDAVHQPELHQLGVHITDRGRNLLSHEGLQSRNDRPNGSTVLHSTYYYAYCKYRKATAHQKS